MAYVFVDIFWKGLRTSVARSLPIRRAIDRAHHAAERAFAAGLAGHARRRFEGNPEDMATSLGKSNADGIQHDVFRQGLQGEEDDRRRICRQLRTAEQICPRAAGVDTERDDLPDK